MAVTEMATLFPKVRWLLPAAPCPSRFHCLFSQQPKRIQIDSSLNYSVLYLPIIWWVGFNVYVNTHSLSLSLITHIVPVGILWGVSVSGRCPSLSLTESPSFSLSPETVLGDRAKLLVSADLQRQQAPWRMPEGHGSQPLPGGHAAGHSTGHPVRLWHC